MAGEGASGKFVISIFPRLENVHDSKNFATVIGISGGLGLIGEIDIVFAGEGDDAYPVGLTIGLGGGEGLEGHAYMTYTKEIITSNIYEWVAGCFAVALT